MCIDYVSNGIESNSCETVVFEKYHFVHITAYYVYRQKIAQIYKIGIAVKDKTKYLIGGFSWKKRRT